MMSRGSLIVLSGPSGAGKSTVIGQLMEMRDDISFSISATTRLPRAGEEDGINYYFKTFEEFNEMLDTDAFLEHAKYAGNYYGTPKAPIELLLEHNRTVILDIEVQGAFQVKKSMPEAVMVFLAPPNIKILENRLRGRKTDSEEKILLRLDTAKKEYARAKDYEYIVINDDAKMAAEELNAIITADSCTVNKRIDIITEE